jgi:hypothetical protein
MLPNAENYGPESSRAKSTAVDFAPHITDMQTHTLSTIVEQFYQHLDQKPSQRKRESGIKEGSKLIKEGFTLEDLTYAASWVIEKYPDTGSFERVSHFIDQALKQRNAEERAQEVERHLQAEAKQRQAEEQQIERERKKIEEIKASLPEEKLEELRRDASRLLQEEKVNVAVGREILLRLKVDELITARYL